ncbi:MAG: PDDEXK nuclease domain-containing protein, partial [Phormidesmis sp. CAN_BIN44]|nr:PDDEXK nuclease domain-containing protein [Phormidesmis sp. CAN_BIN44]
KHNCAVLDKLKNQEQRVWYIQKTIENGWSRSVLIHQIEGDLYSRQGGALTNFEQTLPSPQSDLAQSLLKSEYNLEFLDLREKALERDLERALIERMQKFLLELGVGFAFVGSQYRLEVEGDEFFVDLLFYHLALSCFVAIELKTTDFNSHLAPVSISCKNRDAITINQGFEAHRTARNQVSDIGARSQLSLSIRGRLTSMSMSLMINYAALRITRRSGSFCVALRKSL